MMEFEQVIREKQTVLIDRWVEHVLDTYESSSFFKTQKNRFANPVGTTIRESLAELFGILQDGSDLGKAGPPLERIIKIRAVQDFAPSQATSFIFQIKELVRRELARAKVADTAAALADFDARVDAAALLAFDLYMTCRERLFEIKLRELQSGTQGLTNGMRCPSAILKRGSGDQQAVTNQTD